MAGIVRRLETDLGAEAELFAGERIEVAETGGPVRFYFVDRDGQSRSVRGTVAGDRSKDDRIAFAPQPGVETL